MKIRFVALFFVALCLSGFANAQPKLVSQNVRLNGKSFTLKIASGWEIVPAAQNLKRPRFFAKAPDGRVFVSEMHDRTDNRLGAIAILENFDPKTGKFAKVSRYLSGLRNPNSLAFWRDPKSGKSWIYLALTDQLVRYEFKNGDLKPSGKAQKLASFPAYGLSYKYGGWHLTRTVAFGPNGKLYVSVGSSQNAGIEREKVRATVLELDPDGKNLKIWAKGLRNAVGLKWIGATLYATNQGADHLGDFAPADTFLKLRAGGDYGWPGCYIVKNQAKADPKFLKMGLNLTKPQNVAPTFASFPAHAAALGFDFFDAQTSDRHLKNRFVVALHGSGFRRIGAGYSLVTVDEKGAQNVFLRGFLRGRRVLGRPCDVFKTGPDSFLMSDDFGGVIYLVRRKK